jgi:hypothetical protein
MQKIICQTSIQFCPLYWADFDPLWAYLFAALSLVMVTAAGELKNCSGGYKQTNKQINKPSLEGSFRSLYKEGIYVLFGMTIGLLR